MTRGPRRLKEDLDFQWETGCDLADEQLVVGGYDLASVRTRVVAGAFVAGAAATTATVLVGDGVPAVARVAGWTTAVAVKPLLGALAGGAFLAGAYWLGAQSRNEVVPVVARPVQQMAPRTAQPPVAAPSPAVEMLPVAHGAPTAPTALPMSKPAPATHETQGTAAAGGVGGGSDVALLPDTPTPAPPRPPNVVGQPASGEGKIPSTVPHQLRIIGDAQDAFAANDWQRAETMFRVYLSEYPQGQLVDEAEFGLMQTLFHEGDVSGTEQLALKIQEYPSLTSHRDEIHRLRAESLVKLERCTEALLVAEGLSTRDAAPVKKACRRREAGD